MVTNNQIQPVFEILFTDRQGRRKTNDFLRRGEIKNQCLFPEPFRRFCRRRSSVRCRGTNPATADTRDLTRDRFFNFFSRAIACSPRTVACSCSLFAAGMPMKTALLTAMQIGFGPKCAAMPCRETNNFATSGTANIIPARKQPAAHGFAHRPQCPASRAFS